jgi:hypothetical protein
MTPTDVGLPAAAATVVTFARAWCHAPAACIEIHHLHLGLDWCTLASLSKLHPARDDCAELLVQLPLPLDPVDDWGSRMDHQEGLRSACALVLEVDLLWLTPKLAIAVELDLDKVD